MFIRVHYRLHLPRRHIGNTSTGAQRLGLNLCVQFQINTAGHNERQRGAHNRHTVAPYKDRWSIPKHLGKGATTLGIIYQRLLNIEYR